MQTPAQIKRHPIHPMLVGIPIGLWLFSFVCDLLTLGSSAPHWPVVAFYTMVGGVVGALAAAVPGLIDLLSLPRALKRTALIHMSINLAVVALYLVNLWWRAGEASMAGPFWLSALAIAMLFVSGWLGGKLVYVHGVAVQQPPEPASASKVEQAPRRA